MNHPHSISLELVTNAGVRPQPRLTKKKKKISVYEDSLGDLHANAGLRNAA